MASHVLRLCRTALLLRPVGYFPHYARLVAGARAINDDRIGEGEPENGEQSALAAKIQDPYYGISAASFSQKVAGVLLAPVNDEDVELKPDGLIYLPEIKYRRILNQAFGPGGWALMPRGETLHFQNEQEGAQLITREYSLYCQGRFVAQAMGEHTFYSKSNLQYGKACESAKSNALMRCCKDLGVASELWDPQFVSKWKKEHAAEVWCENQRTREKKRLWRRKHKRDPFPYPWKET